MPANKHKIFAFRFISACCLILSMTICLSGQASEREQNIEADSARIALVEDSVEPDKVLHAEPLYIDLIRDLGARKGEREWNIGYGLTDYRLVDVHNALVEYEFAPVNRLGLEIELPFTFYSNPVDVASDSLPSSQLDGIQLAGQWSFFVDNKISTSMAIGYLHEFEMSDFQNFGNPLFTGNVYNPFFIIAKRWGRNFHSLIYTGPVIEHEFETSTTHTEFDINTSFHYMIPGTDNFVGIEFNKSIEEGDFDMVMRPQMRLDIADKFLLGVVVGIPVSRENERLGFFIRLIYEPEHY